MRISSEEETSRLAGWFSLVGHISLRSTHSADKLKKNRPQLLQVRTEFIIRFLCHQPSEGRKN
jgi:hypothetical protein